MADKNENIKEKLDEIKDLKMDLITFEVLRNAFVAACYEASRTIERIAYHPVIGRGRDRSNGILTPDPYLVAHGHTDSAAHYASFEPRVTEVIKFFPKEEMKPGDIFFSSDPYTDGTHVNDTSLVKPIFFDDEIIAFTCSVIHWPDMGGPNPGSFNPEATSFMAEGLRIPPIKLFEDNKLDEQLFRFISYNIRSATERRGDLQAQFEGTNLIERRIQELCEKYGADTVKLGFEEQFNYSERMFLSDIEALPDGEWEFGDYGDQDTMKPGKPPIKVHCKLIKKGKKLIFDWSECDPQPIGSWGGSRPTLIAGNYLGLMICFPRLFPLNHGIMRNVEIISKPGTCVHVLEPGPLSGYCSGAFDKIEAVSIACLAGPLSKVQPWRVYPAACSLTNMCLGGYNPRTKKDFVQYTYGIGGENARTYADGKELIFMRFCNAMTVPQELEERWFPIIFNNYLALKDSCGHGKTRGGFALIREYDVQADEVLTIHGDREKFPPFGMAGGTNAGGCKLIVNPGTDREQDVGMYATGIQLKKGDHVYYNTAGGGGFGDPLERDPELVLKDVMDEWVSIEAAKEWYGVAIKEIDADALDFQIDEEATKKLREELKNRKVDEGHGPHQVQPYGKDIKLGWEPTEEEVGRHITISRPPGW
ncbi:MAG: hydantoinase B/oxoprolinase family protein [Deltaproteobacteria bacterium]|nr:hydantoinase B/oxoprolinase family protein [Deltaproteobacteria bacterium]